MCCGPEQRVQTPSGKYAREEGEGRRAREKRQLLVYSGHRRRIVTSLPTRDGLCRRHFSSVFLFEYYLVGLRFDWLIVENDHNQVILAQVGV
jgi:hypothetical protein